jgi:hypothetical protein
MGSPSAGVSGPRTSTVGFRLETNRRSSGPTDRPRIDGFAVFDLDVGDAEGREKVKEVVRRVEGDLTLESIGTDTDPKNGRTGDFSVSDDEEASDVDKCPADLVGVHEVANLGTQVRPRNVDLVAEHRAELLQLAISLGSGGFGPRLLPRTVPELGARGQTRVVPHELRLGDNMRRGVRRDAGLVVTVEAELREVGIGEGEGGVLAMLSRKGDTRSDECCRNH